MQKILKYRLEAYSIRMAFTEENRTRQADRQENKRQCVISALSCDDP